MQSSADTSLDDLGRDILSSSLANMARSSKSTESASTSRTLSIAHQDIAGNEIERWQARASTEFASDDEGIVARLLRSCIDSISHLLLSLKQNSVCKNLRRSLSILKLWSMGHGAWDGRLDGMLEKSTDLRRTTLSVLIPFCKALNNGIISTPVISGFVLTAKKVYASMLI